MFRLYKFTTVVCLPVVSGKVYNAINAVNVSFTCKADCIYHTFASIGVLFPQSHIDSAPLDLFVLSLSPPIGCLLVCSKSHIRIPPQQFWAGWKLKEPEHTPYTPHAGSNILARRKVCFGSRPHAPGEPPRLHTELLVRAQNYR